MTSRELEKGVAACIYAFMVDLLEQVVVRSTTIAVNCERRSTQKRHTAPERRRFKEQAVHFRTRAESAREVLALMPDLRESLKSGTYEEWHSNLVYVARAFLDYDRTSYFDGRRTGSDTRLVAFMALYFMDVPIIPSRTGESLVQ